MLVPATIVNNDPPLAALETDWTKIYYVPAESAGGRKSEPIVGGEHSEITNRVVPGDKCDGFRTNASKEH